MVMESQFMIIPNSVLQILKEGEAVMSHDQFYRKYTCYLNRKNVKILHEIIVTSIEE